MKVLFLDIDGVVNCINTRQQHRGAIGIDPHMAFRIGKITIAHPDIKVVLSSSWRHFPDGREEVARQVVPIHDVTPDERGLTSRGTEIKQWLTAHPEVTRYAILDDNSDMLDEQQPNFFRTSWVTGITDEIMEQVIKHFNL